LMTNLTALAGLPGAIRHRRPLQALNAKS
jgi:hypothetical protein